MQLVVATSRSPGCGQRIDDVEMLRRYFRRSSGGSSSSSSGVGRPSLLRATHRLWLLFHWLFSRSEQPRLATFAANRLASSRVRLIARQAVRRGDYVGNRGERRKCATCA
jgi:hypothetical protein